MSEVNPENKCSHLVEGEAKVPTIQEIFGMQLNLQQSLAQTGRAVDPIVASPEEKVADISVQWRNLTLEFAELLERLPFKEWKTYSEIDWIKAFTSDDFIETQFEYIDMLHFFINIGLLLGIDGDRASQLYFLKNKENFARQERGY